MTAATGGTKTRDLDYSIDVFPMMQTHMGYWWSVSDAQGHILKLGRTDTEVQAVEAASNWVVRAEAHAAAGTPAEGGG